jgi:hypothetical protein
MNTQFVWIGHNTEGTSDKIWGYFLTGLGNQPQFASKDYGHSCAVFWAARGKAGTLHFKADQTGHTLRMLKESKVKKGYRSISETKLIELWPTFEEEFSQSLLFQKLAGKIR